MTAGTGPLPSVQSLSLPDAARFYVKEFGWPVFPVWGAREDGGCACPKGLDCPNPAKHPMGDLVSSGLKGATKDPEIVWAWWTRRPEANIGLPTGRRSGVLVIDVDLDKGGFETLAALIRRHEEWPVTPSVRTGGGGLHFFFRYPDDAEIRNDVAKKLGPGLDVRAEGGYILLPPSMHATRRIYEWEAGDDE